MRPLSPSPLSSLLLSACTSVIYKQPMFQGNLLEKTNVDNMAVGMNRQQVYALLGTPSVEDPFHQNRWDYIATQRVGHGKTEIKTYTVHFDRRQGGALGRRVFSLNRMPNWPRKWPSSAICPKTRKRSADQLQRFGFFSGFNAAR